YLDGYSACGWGGSLLQQHYGDTASPQFIKDA
ncbi:unnamed protein product, partial [marine sediment metagenome]